MPSLSSLSSTRFRQRGAAILPPPPFVPPSILHGKRSHLSAPPSVLFDTSSTQWRLCRMWRASLKLTSVMLVLVIFVIALGAWTRLVDAGLGCPDWPGCYGALVVPDAQVASLHSPHHPLESYKAWAEMIHRYAASSLGLAAIGLVILGLRIKRLEKLVSRSSKRPPSLNRSQSLNKATATSPAHFPLTACWLLLGVLLVQGAFGAFTVTLKLWPQVVTLHLLGGLAVMSLLVVLWLTLRQRLGDRTLVRPRAEIEIAPAAVQSTRLHQPWLVAAAVVALIVQLALGGWTSSNYAGLACTGFPGCNDSLWPTMDWGEGFHLTQDVGPSYLYGQLHGEARTAIHMAHRGGALLLGGILMALYWRQRRYGRWQWRVTARAEARPIHGALGNFSGRPHNPWRWVLVCWGLQAVLGIANVLWWLPLDLALAHTLGAVALTGALVLGVHETRKPREEIRLANTRDHAIK